ncbi:major facilitator superfamily domain-containing protein [Coniochaeta sp. 2T2.1]|nr:major facilitator superfamily domain-containing protein [Coniochaeta sp. 2T2.1]
MSSDDRTKEGSIRLRRPSSFSVAFAGLCLCVFIATVDTIILASALPAIAADLSATTNQAFWYSVVLLFAQCVAQPVYGTLTEVFGRKRCMIAALLMFGFSSLFGALAPNIECLIVARALQGLGTGGINVCVNVLVVDLVPQRQRAKMSGILSLAGALVSSTSTPISACAIIVFCFFLKLPSVGVKTKTQLRTMDWVGILIFSGSVSGILFALVTGGNEYSWSSPHILVPLVFGIVFLAVFVGFEETLAGRHGLGPAFIPLRLFSRRTAAFGFLMTFLHGMILWAIPYYYLLYLNISASKSLLRASVLVLPSTFIIPVSAAVAGILMSRLGHFKYFNALAFALMAAGCGALSALRADPSDAVIMGMQLLFSLGGGILFPGRLVAVRAAQRGLPEGQGEDRSDVRMATSLVSFMTSLGQAFGIAMGSTALQNAWGALVRKVAAAGALSDKGRTFIIPASQASTTANAIVKLPPSVAAQYRTIAALIMARVWYICTGLAPLGSVAAVASRNLKLYEKEAPVEKRVREQRV